jgi:hypothetical protein
MATVPTFKQLVERADNNLWMDLDNLSDIVNALRSMPDPDLIGDTSVIELVSSKHGYNLGWAFVHPDLNAWVYVQSDQNDSTVDNREQ